MITLSAPQIVTPNAVLDDAWVTVDSGRIVAIGTGEPQGASTQVDGALVPGFVDIHCHGGGGFSFDDPVAATSAAEFHLGHGTTSMLASLVSAPVHDQVRLLSALRGVVSSGAVAGVHLEGPFLSLRYCGAQNPRALTDPSTADVDALLAAAPGVLKLITIAPELPGALDAIRRFADAGVVVAIGHSDCTAEEAQAAVAAGATVVTHLFNAMRHFHHREHGLAEYALTDGRLATEVIADGIHLGDLALRVVADTKRDRLIAVTDAMSAAGMPDGEYRLGGLDVTCADGAARLTGTSTLAGSTLTMDRAFSHLHNVIGLDLGATAHACATEPARALGLSDVGCIEVDKQADFVVWKDGVQAVFKNGIKVH
ncbi:MAG: N-acetylglucosamine-6-phosphate deacetylase [Actinomycetota bacterium]